MRRELVSGSGLGPSSKGEVPQSKFVSLGDALLALSNAALTAARRPREMLAFGFPISMCMRCSRDNPSTFGTESLLGTTKPGGGCCWLGFSEMSDRKLSAVMRTSSRLGRKSQHWSFCRSIRVLSGHQLICERLSRSRSFKHAIISFHVSCNASWRIRLRMTFEYFHWSKVEPFFMCLATWSQRSSQPILTSLHLSNPQPKTRLGSNEMPISVKEGSGRPEWYRWWCLTKSFCRSKIRLQPFTRHGQSSPVSCILISCFFQSDFALNVFSVFASAQYVQNMKESPERLAPRSVGNDAMLMSSSVGVYTCSCFASIGLSMSDDGVSIDSTGRVGSNGCLWSREVG